MIDMLFGGGYSSYHWSKDIRKSKKTWEQKFMRKVGQVAEIVDMPERDVKYYFDRVFQEAEDPANKHLIEHFLMRAKLAYGGELADIKSAEEKKEQENKERHERARRIRIHSRLRRDRQRERCEAIAKHIKETGSLPPDSWGWNHVVEQMLEERKIIRRRFWQTWTVKNEFYVYPDKLKKSLSFSP